MSTDKNSNKNPPDYCSHCKRLYHTSQSCWKLHLELRSKPSKKRKITRDDQEQLHQIMMAITNHKEKSPLSDVWILDSGAEEHVCCRKEDFVHINPAPGQAIVGPGNVKHFAEGRGTVKLECVVKGKTAWLTLTDVLFIPTAGVNLLAVASIQDKGGDVVFRRNGSTQIICPKLTFTASRYRKLFVLDQPQKTPPTITLAAYSLSEPWLNIWHRRLGHLGEQGIKDLIKISTGIHEIKDSHICESCVLGRMKEWPHKHRITPGSYPLELIHTAICGPFDEMGWNGTRYWVTFIDDYTRWAEAVPIRQKSDFFSEFKSFLARFERPERRCHRIRFDDSGEARLTEFREFCVDRGITAEVSTTEQHQQNAIAEVFNRIYMDKLQPTIIDSGLDMKWWPEVLGSMVHIRNRCPIEIKGSKTTPYELWYGDKSDLSHLRIIGSKCWSLKSSKNRKKLVHEKAKECRLLGYDGHTIYKLLTIEGQIIRSSNVQFCENRLHNSAVSDVIAERVTERLSKSPIETTDDNMDSNKRQSKHPIETTDENMGSKKRHCSNYTPVSGGEVVAHSSLEKLNELEPQVSEPADVSQDIDVMALNPTRSNTTVLDDEQAYTSDTTTEREANLRVSTRINKGQLPKRFTLLATLLATASEGNEPFEPKTVKQAQNDERWSDWKEAMEDELRSLQKNKTWQIVNRPENRKVPRGKWVYKLKRGPNGEISRDKARWVVRGFEQEEGLN
ncbi:hypothetical protein K3495_g14147 [Podosphaera aphanis]|nr:hypothetical protein K3495_g14147 [Podosphaera aphanis]